MPKGACNEEKTLRYASKRDIVGTAGLLRRARSIYLLSPPKLAVSQARTTTQQGRK